MVNENLFVEERRRLILEQLTQHGRVSVKTLSDRLGVSTVTIRQDLRALAESGYLERTYGGAVRKAESEAPPELSFHVRQKRNSQNKEAIAAAAAALVKDGSSVALDASSTVFAMSRYLKKLKKLTVVTNSLITAQSFLDSPHIQVLIPGGRLRRDSISIVGKPDGLPTINLNYGFFGTRGLSPGSGITDVDADEVSIKQAMIAHCVSAVVLADGSKWGEVAPYTFASFQEIERIITDDSAPEDMLDQVRRQGVQIQIIR
jgi:DeoR family transcriptional regulator, fructose operon transcriptional repressor